MEHLGKGHDEARGPGKLMRGAAVLALLILAGCATDYESRCDAAAAVLITYKAVKAAGGSVAPARMAMVEAAAETMLMLRCPPVAPPR